MIFTADYESDFYNLEVDNNSFGGCEVFYLYIGSQGTGLQKDRGMHPLGQRDKTPNCGTIILHRKKSHGWPNFA